MIGFLPTTLTIDGTEYGIESDFRAVLEVFEMFMDIDMDFDNEQVEAYEKWMCAIYILFDKYNSIDEVEEDIESGVLPLDETTRQIKWFINAGSEESTSKSNAVFDWVDDEQLIFSAVNDVAKKETRSCDYIHWWTFLGYFNQIGEGLFSTVIHLREKMAKGRKLEKHEREFVNAHSQMFVRKERVSKEKQDILDRLNSGEMFT